MKIFIILCGLCVLLFVAEIRNFWSPSSSSATCTSGQSGTPVVIHTNGGLLEVSRIHAIEVFEATTRERILGVPIGNTVARIRVPAVYRYHVELAPEWTVHLKDKRFIVIAPPVRTSVPVAIDTGRLQAEASGTWSMFTGTARVDELRQSITKTLGCQGWVAGLCAATARSVSQDPQGIRAEVARDAGSMEGGVGVPHTCLLR